MKDIISIVEDGQIKPLVFKLSRRIIEKLNESKDNGFCSKFIEGITISDYIAKHVHE
ncbi:MAG: hypothetical protein VXY28_08820 [Bacteroidota bacterium]|nr:hypothetical protein [Bacteroidota bacterium]